MIGFYVHHHGLGHRRRAALVAAALGEPVVGMGTGPAPTGWCGAWVSLPPDDDVPGRTSLDATANGLLHWVPKTAGVRRRAAAIAASLETYRPRLVVVDVSVEAALLVRLHGIPVVVVAQPGVRDDAAHALGQRLAAAILAPWPAWAGDRPWRPAPGTSAVPVGAIGAWPCDTSTTARDPDTVAVLVGRGGHSLTPDLIDAVAAAHPRRRFHLVGDVRAGQRHPNVVAHGWVDDVQQLLRRVGVVVSHGGQTAVATVAATRTPAVLVAQRRPFAEQETLVRMLGEEGLAEAVEPDPCVDALASALGRAAETTGDQWARWDDGLGAQRAATLLGEVAGRGA